MHQAAPHPFDLLNDWQRGFPLVRAPFAVIAHRAGLPEHRVIEIYRDAQRSGALSRIGGVFDARAGGAGVLAAIAVPPERLEAVAALVSAHPGVNHNYEREHALNLWFVMTGADSATLARDLSALETATMPARAPASMAMLHIVIRDSIDSARTASPANSMA